MGGKRTKTIPEQAVEALSEDFKKSVEAGKEFNYHPDTLEKKILEIARGSRYVPIVKTNGASPKPKTAVKQGSKKTG